MGYGSVFKSAEHDERGTRAVIEARDGFRNRGHGGKEGWILIRVEKRLAAVFRVDVILQNDVNELPVRTNRFAKSPNPL